MKENKKNKSFRHHTQTHQPTVTRSDLYDKGELVLKDMGGVDQNLKNLKKILKKTKKQLEKHRKKKPEN